MESQLNTYKVANVLFAKEELSTFAEAWHAIISSFKDLHMW